MIIISHRGNLDGPNKIAENKIETIISTIDLGFDCEVDLWYISDQFLLGHDSPETLVDFDFIYNLRNKLWIHCKNVECMEKLNKTDFNFFWHDKDLATLTSKGFFWTQPNTYLESGITVELSYKDLPSKILGVCTDFPKKYKDKNAKI